MIKRWILAVTLGVACAVAGAESFVVFDVPGSDLTGAMNNSGVVTGSYAVGDRTHGFVRSPEGTLTTFEAVTGAWTHPHAINESGVIAGYVEVPIGTGVNYQGFYREPNGQVTVFLVPNADVAVSTINGSGAMGGLIYSNVGKPTQGFTRDLGGSTQLIDLPNLQWLQFATLNDRGDIAGIAQVDDTSPTPVSLGFVRTADGSLSTFAPPPTSRTRLARIQLTSMAMNNTGTVVGSVLDVIVVYPIAWSQDPRVFIRKPDGSMEIFRISNASLRDGIMASGINNSGAITGYYYENTRRRPRGYARDAQGIVTTFAVPAMNSTMPVSINDNGWIFGYCFDFNGVRHGFIRKP